MISYDFDFNLFKTRIVKLELISLIVMKHKHFPIIFIPNKKIDRTKKVC